MLHHAEVQGVEITDRDAKILDLIQVPGCLCLTRLWMHLHPFVPKKQMCNTTMPLTVWFALWSGLSLTRIQRRRLTTTQPANTIPWHMCITCTTSGQNMVACFLRTSSAGFIACSGFLF